MKSRGFIPTKCKKFIPDKFIYPADAQPKMNGNRMTARYDVCGEGLFTQHEVVLETYGGIRVRIDHIEKILEPIFKVNPDLILDGEMYLHGEPVTTISGACRNPENSIHKDLTYVVYDLVATDDQAFRLFVLNNLFTIFEGRIFNSLTLDQFCTNAYAKGKVVKIYNEIVNNDEEASNIRDVFISHGFEGAVIRNLKATYPFNKDRTKEIRSKDLMKLKKWFYMEFHLQSVIGFGFENKENDIGKGCTCIFKNDITEDTFESNLQGNAYQKEKFYETHKQFIGKRFVVRFAERTINKLPFHSNVIVDYDTLFAKL